MPSKNTVLSAILAGALLSPIAMAESNFNYDFYEVGISSTNEDNESYTSLAASGSMEINNNHYITGGVKTDITSNATANEISVGIGAYKPSSEDMDYYSRAGFKHGKDDSGSHQTVNVGFGARFQLSDAIELEGGIDLLFSNADEGTGVSGTASALYDIDEKIQVGAGLASDGDQTETRLFTRVKML